MVSSRDSELDADESQVNQAINLQKNHEFDGSHMSDIQDKIDNANLSVIDKYHYVLSSSSVEVLMITSACTYVMIILDLMYMYFYYIQFILDHN